MSMNYTEKDFIGSWKTDQREAQAEPQDGDVTINFDDDGSAKYVIYYADKRDVVHLTYKVDGDHIVIEQPPQGVPMSVKFAFNTDGSLLLWFNNVKGRFLRVATQQ